MFFSVLLSIVFFSISGIHWYWLFGGEFGFAQSLPTNEAGGRVLNPKKVDTLVVAVGFVVFALFYLLKVNLITMEGSEWILKYGTWVIPSIFLLRAIGEFKYVGFFKKVKNTVFGSLDTKYYSPLCLLIAVIGFSLAV